jgi:AcrR family transcriptional regulator
MNVTLRATFGHASGVTGVTGLRERKKAQTRAAIEAAAMALFARDGFAATTIPAIAAACDVAPRTFFRYFATKEDVLLAASASRLDLLIELVRAEPHDRPLFAVVRGAMLTLAVEYERQRDVVLLHADVLDRNPALRARGLEAQQTWEARLAEALAERHDVGPGGPSSLEIRLVAGVAIAALRAAVDEWVAEGCSPDLAALVAEAFVLFTALERHRTTAGGGR